MSSVAMLYGKKKSSSSTTLNSSSESSSTNITSVSAEVNTLAPGSAATVSATLSESSLDFQFGLPGSATDYAQLTNKPQIEGVTLAGNKTYPDLNLEAISGETITNIFNS